MAVQSSRCVRNNKGWWLFVRCCLNFSDDQWTRGRRRRWFQIPHAYFLYVDNLVGIVAIDDFRIRVVVQRHVTQVGIRRCRRWDVDILVKVRV